MKTSIKKISAALMVLLIACSSLHATLTITPSFTPACQAGTGAVTFTVTGGSGSYTFYLYNLRSGSSLQQTSPTFTNLSVSDYQLFVTGSLDSGALSFHLPAVVTASITTTPATCTQLNGVLTITPSGGTAPYSYYWYDGAGSTTATITNGRGGGYYAAYATDANGCVSDTVVALEGQTSPVSVSITASGSLCNQTLTAVATGGGPSYSYHWSNGVNTAALTGVNVSGTYYVTATDPNGCAASQSLSVTATNLVLDSTNSVVVSPTCGANGSITVNMNTGTAPYTYQWSPLSGNTNTQSNLSAYTYYYLTVTDANGCTNSNVYYLSSNQLTSVQICNYGYPDCGSANGYLTACAYGGSGTPSYAWSSGQQTSAITGLAAGTYNVTASLGGCTVSASTVLRGRANYEVTVTTTPTACDTALHTGTATAVVSGTGGTAPYTFVWHGASYPTSIAPVIGSGQSISGLSLYEYVYADVTDANGCIPTYSYDSSYITIDPACYDHITGYIYTDVNGNCIHDAGDQGVSAVNVSANGANGSAYYASPDTSGYYDIWVLPGAYSVTANFYNSGVCAIGTCVSSYQDTFTTTGQTISGNDIGIGGLSDFDLGVHMGYQGSAPGQSREYWVYYYNWGQQSVANGTLTFVYDPNITLTSTNPPYTTHNASTHTITWDIVNNLSHMYWLDAQHQVVMYFDIPSTLSLGTPLTAHADISPVTGDCDSLDNSQNLTDVVSASHDPNEKEVSPAGNLTASDTVLTYTLRFQNDGNAPANLVVIKDTLSSNVDASTVKPGASSAPYQFAISGNGILTFTFSNIYLPDSSHGDSSKGFVMYTVRVKKNLPLGAVINNTGYIYFDANTAVVTNTTSNLRSDFPTSIRPIIGTAMSAQVQPNPAHDRALIEFRGATGAVDMQITDALGQTLLSTTVSGGSYALQADHFAPGMYFYTAKDAAGNRASGKISIVR